MNATTISNATQTREPAKNLSPKEHGAYAILAVPIISALLIAGPTLPGLCVAVAAVTGFLAHEPLLIAWGHRGSRAQRTTPAAKNRLVVLLAITVTCGSLGWLLSATPVRIALVACLAIAVSSFAVAMFGKHRSLGGQVWGIVGLSIACVPILLAGGQPVSQTLEIWTTWLIGFASTTMAVRGIIGAQKRQSRAIHWSTITGLSVLMGVLMSLGYALAITALPMILMSWYLMIQPPPARQLKRVGWSLVAGTITTAVWMVSLA